MKMTKTENEIIIENNQLFLLAFCALVVVGGVVVAVQSAVGGISWLQLAIGVALAAGAVAGAFFVKNHRYVLRRDGESEVIAKSIILRKETRWTFQAADVASVLRTRYIETKRDKDNRETKSYKTAIAIKLKDGREIEVYEKNSSGNDKTVDEAEEVRRMADELAQFYGVTVEADEDGAAAAVNGLKDLVSIFKGGSRSTPAQPSTQNALTGGSEQTVDPVQVAATTPAVEMAPTPAHAVPTAPENEAVAPSPAFAANPLAAAAVSDSMQPAGATGVPAAAPVAQEVPAVAVAPQQTAPVNDPAAITTPNPAAAPVAEVPLETVPDIAMTPVDPTPVAPAPSPVSPVAPTSPVQPAEYSMPTPAPVPTAAPLAVPVPPTPVATPAPTPRPIQAQAQSADRPIASLGRTGSPMAASRPAPTLPPRQ